MESRRISRKTLLLALLPLLAVAGIAGLLATDGPPASEAISPRSPGPTPDRLTLDDGEELRGEVLEASTDHVTLRLADGTVRLVSRERVQELRRGPTRAGEAVRVRLRSGRTVEGELVRRTAQGIELRLMPSGTLVSLRREDVTQVEEQP